MRVLCSSVLAIEAIVVFLATSLATSNGSVSNTALAWIVGLVLMVLLVLAIGTLGRRWGVALGWVLQALVLATSIVVGWSMLIVGGVFVLLWFLAVRNGSRVDALRSAAGDGEELPG
ncbi:MAG: DUF4233 domain-containing protein [Actinobacteria bacterium]|jgi:hypothetical protein|nr:DUF4233 domain-containing protein [Actinomycetota bacterium]